MSLQFHKPPGAVGPGTQPGEADGAELLTPALPEGMSTFSMPALPEPEEVTGLAAGKALLAQLHTALCDYRVEQPPRRFDLAGLPAADRELVDQVLGEGEVSIRIGGELPLQIQESVLAGVWRVQAMDRHGLHADHIELAAIPAAVTAAGAERVAMPEALPAGVRNAPALLAEINEHIGRHRDEPHVINLSLLPHTEEDLAFLDERLGKGAITILSRGYGNCRINGTATRDLWWVQYFNSQDALILNSLEITAVPQVACAAQEDIEDSAERLGEVLELYR